MTDLVQDAMDIKISDSMKYVFNERIKVETLQEMLSDLDEREVISVIFLMVDENTDCLMTVEEMKQNPRAAFTRLNTKKAWTVKLIESLIIIGNKYVIGKMGFNNNDIKNMENSFVVKEHNVSPNLNKAIKSLFFLCENLDDNDVKKLVIDVNNKLCKPLDINPDNVYLEIYILEWLQEQYISIDPDKFDLSNLVKSLKNIGCLLDLPFYFDYWEIRDSLFNKNEQDSEVNSRILDKKNTSLYSNTNSNLVSTNSDIMWSTPDHRKLCIIINQIDFTDTKKYERRDGSEVDEQNLAETFQGCGFEIDNDHKNLKQQDMEKLLESLNSNFYSKYGAIFMCILSHGFEGEVVFTDDNSIPIATIEEKFCCKKLRNVFKCLILQSCQGKQKGLVERQLVRDGPADSINPFLRMHYVLFKATINNFAAMRHKQEGSWFIQDLCQEIKEANAPLEILELMRRVKSRVSKRRALADNLCQEIGQMPISSDTVTIPYEIPKFKKKLTSNKDM